MPGASDTQRSDTAQSLLTRPRALWSRLAALFQKPSWQQRAAQNDPDWEEAFTATLRLDPDELDSVLHPAARGAEDGAKLIPPSQATEHDHFHRSLMAETEAVMHRQVGRRLQVLKRFEQELAAVDLPSVERELADQYRQAVSVDLPQIFREREGDLIQARVAYGQSARAYKLFQTQHNRVRDADPPKNAYFGATLVNNAVAIEVILNVQFLKAGMENGTTQAAAVALAVACMNVGVSFAAGLILGKGLNYIDSFRDKKLKARFGLTAYIILIALAQIAFANLRTDISLNPGESADHHTRAMASLQMFHDWESILMAIIGLIFAGIGFYEGYDFTGDRYPGYWKEKQKLLKARHTFEAMRRELEDTVSRLFSDVADSMDATLAPVSLKIERFDKIRSIYQHCASVHQMEYLRAESIVNLLAQTYREANIAHRASVPAPLYFSVPLHLPQSVSFEALNVDERWRQLKEGLDSAKSDVTAYQAKLRDQQEIWIGKVAEVVARAEGVAKDMLSNPAVRPGRGQTDDYDF